MLSIRNFVRQVLFGREQISSTQKTRQEVVTALARGMLQDSSLRKYVDYTVYKLMEDPSKDISDFIRNLPNDPDAKDPYKLAQQLLRKKT